MFPEENDGDKILQISDIHAQNLKSKNWNHLIHVKSLKELFTLVPGEFQNNTTIKKNFFFMQNIHWKKKIDIKKATAAKYRSKK